jgi:hypothetical protein
MLRWIEGTTGEDDVHIKGMAFRRDVLSSYYGYLERKASEMIPQ